MPPCLTLSIIRYGSRVKWSNPGKGVAPSPTPWCSKLSKREPSGHPRLWSPTLLLLTLSNNFLIFSFICLFNGVHFQYSRVFAIFFFFKRSDALLSRQFCFLCCFSFPFLLSAWLIFHCQILFLYSGSIFLLVVSRSSFIFPFWKISWFHPYT